MHHFGRRDRNERFPFFFELLIADETGTMKVAIWNSLCEQYYAHVWVDDVIAVEG
jgi:hypothetical protein